MNQRNRRHIVFILFLVVSTHLLAQKILDLYPAGNHGFVLSLPTDEWMKPLFDWMSKSGW